MITLTLLHPVQSTPVQSWTFEHEPIIRIGRSTDNHVILYSAVVSRHHVELRQVNSHWEIFNLGTNGMYVNGKQVMQAVVEDGVVIRLARSGPNVQIHLKAVSAEGFAGETTLAQRIRSKMASATTDPTAKEPIEATEPTTSLPLTDLNDAPSPPSDRIVVDEALLAIDTEQLPAESADRCTHSRAASEMSFCPDCGEPLRVLQTVGGYQVIRTLRNVGICLTQLVWRDGQSYWMRTLNPNWAQDPSAIEQFKQRASALLSLSHPRLPQFLDMFTEARQPYLVLNPVYGQTLHQLVAQRGPLSPTQALAVMQQVCEVLGYLHQQSPSIVHQDLQPEHLVARSPAVGDLNLTVTGLLSLPELQLDTQAAIGYRAPEQSLRQASIASDLFALGPILVYLLTGKDPHSFYAQREQGFRFYPEYVPGLTPDLIAIVRRLTNPNPAERYRSSDEVAAALRQSNTEKL